VDGFVMLSSFPRITESIQSTLVSCMVSHAESRYIHA
jgi:hypothetical protein